jgi:hypothetical protein
MNPNKKFSLRLRRTKVPLTHSVHTEAAAKEQIVKDKSGIKDLTPIRKAIIATIKEHTIGIVKFLRKADLDVCRHGSNGPTPIKKTNAKNKGPAVRS